MPLVNRSINHPNDIDVYALSYMISLSKDKSANLLKIVMKLKILNLIAVIGSEYDSSIIETDAGLIHEIGLVLQCRHFWESQELEYILFSGNTCGNHHHAFKEYKTNCWSKDRSVNSFFLLLFLKSVHKFNVWFKNNFSCYDAFHPFIWACENLQLNLQLIAILGKHTFYSYIIVTELGFCVGAGRISDKA